MLNVSERDDTSSRCGSGIRYFSAVLDDIEDGEVHKRVVDKVVQARLWDVELAARKNSEENVENTVNTATGRPA